MDDKIRRAEDLGRVLDRKEARNRLLKKIAEMVISVTGGVLRELVGEISNDLRNELQEIKENIEEATHMSFLLLWLLIGLLLFLLPIWGPFLIMAWFVGGLIGLFKKAVRGVKLLFGYPDELMAPIVCYVCKRGDCRLDICKQCRRRMCDEHGAFGFCIACAKKF